MQTWPAANAIYRRETYDNYPAAKAILQSVFEGLQLPIDSALAVEARYFAKVVLSKEAAAMIRSLFLSMGELNKGARRPAEISADQAAQDRRARRRLHGRRHRLCQRQRRARRRADRPRPGIGRQGQGAFAKADRKPGRQGPGQDGRSRRAAGAHQASADYQDLAGCDLVVEAVFEDRAVKAEATQKAQAVVGPDVIFATNTSTLPITSLAGRSLRPDNFIGVHFFSPVDRMMLVEIIMGEKTGPRALAAAMDFVRAIKKTPIVVNDCRGFYANRCVGAYIREGHRMLMEGVPPAMIENAARMAGMPVGPLSLNDEVGIDLGWKILNATKKDLGADAIDPVQEKLLEAMVVGQKRFGRKNAKGFYDYPEKGQKSLWPGLAGSPARRSIPTRSPCRS